MPDALQSRSPIMPTGQFLGVYQPIPWDLLPDLGLYMDQVVLYLEQRCRPLYTSPGQFITPAMINNYVKSGLLLRPDRKKYGRAHLALLVMLCTLKQVSSLEEMKLLLHTTDASGIQSLYEQFCTTQTTVLAALIARTTESTALEYAIEAASFRILCAEMLKTESAASPANEQ